MESVLAQPVLFGFFGIDRVCLDIIRHRLVEGGVEVCHGFGLGNFMKTGVYYIQGGGIVSVCFLMVSLAFSLGYV